MLRVLLSSLALTLAGCPTSTLAPDAGVDTSAGSDAGHDAPRAMRDAPPAARRPQLLWPSGGTITAAASPTFRWIPSPDAPRSRLDICLDAGCTIVEATLETSEAEARIALDQVQRFWRVTAIDERGQAVATSPSWLFGVGTRDEDTDALLDLLAGVPSAGGEIVFDGALAAARHVRDGAGPLPPLVFIASVSTAPDGYLPFYRSAAMRLAESGPRRGRRLARAGDLDGDGLPDGVVDEDGALTFLLWDGVPAGQLAVETAESGGLGDFDGDGDGDLGLTHDAQLYVFALARGDRLDTLLTVPVGAPIFERGDFDGDGLGDALTTRPEGGLQICFGTPSAASCEAIDDTVRPDDFRMVGDVVGDASTDFVVRVGGDLELWAGATSRRFDARQPLPWAGPGRVALHAIAGVGDLDEDGFGELAISVETGDVIAPYRVLVFRGGALTPTPMPDVVPSRMGPHHLVSMHFNRALLGLLFDGTDGTLPILSYRWEDGAWTERLRTDPTCPGCSFEVEAAR